MIDLPVLYLILTLLLAVLVSITIWSRRGFKWRMSGFLVGVLAIAISYLAYVDLLARPKPVELEMSHRGVSEFDVLYADWTEGEAIYLLVQIPDEIEPRFYRLPWSIRRAEDLQEAMTEAGEKEVDLKIGNPFFDPDVEDRERLFYATPQRSPPRKGTQRIDPAKFDPNDPQSYYGEQDQ